MLTIRVAPACATSALARIRDFASQVVPHGSFEGEQGEHFRFRFGLDAETGHGTVTLADVFEAMELAVAAGGEFFETILDYSVSRECVEDALLEALNREDIPRPPRGGLVQGWESIR